LEVKVLPFINRKDELLILNKLKVKPGLIVVYGRRRHGKTRLLTHWLTSNKGIYLQAIEGSEYIQIEQLYSDLIEQTELPAPPQNWSQFFKLIDSIPENLILCIDEFPYLVASTPNLPSQIQKWWDHRKKRNISLILSGSSRKMMENIFLDSQAPLYGRADHILQIKAMTYSAFCSVLKLNQSDEKSFQYYSLTGGIPKYWELLDVGNSVLQNAEDLFFSFSSIMEQEPHKWMDDDQVRGLVSLSTLTAIGKGAHKPSEIAARINTKQTNLSRSLENLTKYDFIKKEIPFGANSKDNKKVLYNIFDPTLRFWFEVYQIHRNLWKSYKPEQKEQIIRLHSSKVYEEYVRQNLEAQRYWENHIEFDAVRELNNLIEVFEIKFSKITNQKKKELEKKLETQCLLSKIKQRKTPIKYSIIGTEFLEHLK
jgi:AAA+ ATPase superfamily predicted ATPase